MREKKKTVLANPSSKTSQSIEEFSSAKAAKLVTDSKVSQHRIAARFCATQLLFSNTYEPCKQ